MAIGILELSSMCEIAQVRSTISTSLPVSFTDWASSAANRLPPTISTPDSSVVVRFNFFAKGQLKIRGGQPSKDECEC